MARSKYSRRRSHHKRIALAKGASAAEGLQADAASTQAGSAGYEQDTPGRPKTASSRQQTSAGQSIQSGSAELDGESPARGKRQPR